MQQAARPLFEAGSAVLLRSSHYWDPYPLSIHALRCKEFSLSDCTPLQLPPLRCSLS